MMVGYATRIWRPEDDQNMVFLSYLLNYATNGKTEGIGVLSGSMQSIPVCQTLCIDQLDPTISPFDRFSGSREFWVEICEEYE